MPDFQLDQNAANLLAAIMHKASLGDAGTSAATNPAAATGTSTAQQEGQSIIDRATTPVTQPTAPDQTTTTTQTKPAAGSDAVGIGAGQENVQQGYMHNGHPGIDLGVPVGTPLVAAEAGTITAAGNTDPGGYGNEVEITAPDGTVMRYGHLSKIGVTLGQHVSQGAPIGASGGLQGAPGSGNATGSGHLHFEVRKGGSTVDPVPYLAGSGGVVDGSATSNPAAQSVPAAPVDPEATAGANIIAKAAGQPLHDAQQPQTPGQVAAAPVASGPEDKATGLPAEATGWIRQAMAITGVPADWFPSLAKIMKRESGGQNIPQGIQDVNSARGIPAFGPMQVIEPTFNAYKLKGHEDWHNPLDNVIAAIRYIQARYGRPDNGPDGPGGY